MLLNRAAAPQEPQAAAGCCVQGCCCGQSRAAAAHAAHVAGGCGVACVHGGGVAAVGAAQGCQPGSCHLPVQQLLRLQRQPGCWCWSQGRGLRPRCPTSWGRSCAWGSAGCCCPRLLQPLPLERPGCPEASPAGRHCCCRPAARWETPPAGRPRLPAGACVPPHPAHKSETS